MSPEEIQVMLSDAVPELKWVVSGHRVVADGLLIRAYYGPLPTTGMWPTANMLRFVHSHGTASRTVHPDDLGRKDLMDLVHSLLTDDAIRTHRGAQQLDAHVQVAKARAKVSRMEEGLSICKAERDEASAALAQAQTRDLSAQWNVCDAQRQLAGAKGLGAGQSGSPRGEGGVCMTYYLFAYCRRNGVSRDQCLAASGDFPNDISARIELQAEAAYLKALYSEIQWTLKAGGDEHGGPDGRLVASWSWRAP